MLKIAKSTAAILAVFTEMCDIRIMSTAENSRGIIIHLCQLLISRFIMQFLELFEINLIRFSTKWAYNCLEIIEDFISLFSSAFLTNFMVAVCKWDAWIFNHTI